MDAPFPVNMVERLEHFLSTDHLRSEGHDLYDEVFDDPLTMPLQRKNELAEMMRQARKYEPRVVFEIGADKGGGLYHWCKSLPTVQRVIACEIRGTPYRHLFEKTFPDINFLWLEGSSYEHHTARKVSLWLGPDKIDCLFIDGDKTKFLEDFWVYRSLMNEPSVVFMHDIQDREPKKAYETVRQMGYDCESLVDTTEAVIALTRQEEGVPSTGCYEDWLRWWKGTSAGVGVIRIK